jgi:single-stranded DNA-binding protein
MVTGRLRQRSWETPESDKRSVTELEADEVGASLKWATAQGRADQPARQRRPQPGAGAAGRTRRRLQRRAPDLEGPVQVEVWVGATDREPAGRLLYEGELLVPSRARWWAAR